MGNLCVDSAASNDATRCPPAESPARTIRFGDIPESSSAEYAARASTSAAGWGSSGASRYAIETAGIPAFLASAPVIARWSLGEPNTYPPPCRYRMTLLRSESAYSVRSARTPPTDTQDSFAPRGRGGRTRLKRALVNQSCHPRTRRWSPAGRTMQASIQRIHLLARLGAWAPANAALLMFPISSTGWCSFPARYCRKVPTGTLKSAGRMPMPMPCGRFKIWPDVSRRPVVVRT